MKTIREVWYGQRSLTQTYWKWNFLFGLVLLGFGGGFLAGVLSAVTERMYPLYFYMALLIPYSIWISVGLWRSATNNPGGWAIVVKILIVIGVVGQIINIVQMLTLTPEEFMNVELLSTSNFG